MSAYPVKQPRCQGEKILERKANEGHPEGKAPPVSNVFGRLSELHTDILSTAEIVKHVQEEVWRLTQENETLRKRLTLAELPVVTNGEDPTLRSSGFATTFIGKNSDKPTAPTAEPAVIEELVLPFSVEVDWKPADSDWKVAESISIKAASEGKAKKARVVGWEETLGSNLRGNQILRDSHNSQASRHDGNVRKETSYGGWRESIKKYSVFPRKRTGSLDEQDQKRRHKVRGMIFDQDMVKEQLKKNIVKPDFNIARFYHTTGYAQWIVRSRNFESISLVVIAANNIWIAIDTEHNREDLLLDADIGFQIIEHIFCAFFFFELLFRFAAFEVKRNCFRSGWFIFDCFLVATMVFEDWIISVVLLASSGASGENVQSVSVFKNTAILRVLRLLRLARLGRCLKLMRSSPEVMIMVKAMWGSFRCVIWTCVLLAAMMFGFGVSFTTMCKGTTLEALYFPSLTGSLHTLLIAGLFPDLEIISKNINRESLLFWLIFLVYLIVTTICVLNLLIGVLVEVVKSSSLVERDAMDVAYVKQTFLTALSLTEADDITDVLVHKEEFLHILQDSQILEVLTKVGIDVIGLVDLIDFIFIQGAVGCADLLEGVLQLRSAADVTVKDVVEVRKFLTYEINNLKQQLQKINFGLMSQAKALESMPADIFHR